MKAKQIILLILRLLLGAFFVTTAVLKLLSIDEFEIYIYSFNIFNFIFSTVVARMVIAAEMLLGICLMAKILYKYAWILTQLMLLGFTLLLVYVLLFREDTNCHCLGSLVEVDPVMSILKNVVTSALLLLVRKEEDYQFRKKKLAIVGAVIVSVIVPFCVFPMDTIYNQFVSPISEINTDKFADLQVDSTMSDFDISQGNYVVAVYASGCKYCKMSAKKMNEMIQKNAIDESRFQILIWGDTAQIDTFRVKTNCESYEHHIINPYTAIDVTYGKFPMFIMTHNKQIVKAFDYRGLEEKEIVDFLK